MITYIEVVLFNGKKPIGSDRFFYCNLLWKRKSCIVFKDLRLVKTVLFYRQYLQKKRPI